MRVVIGSGLITIGFGLIVIIVCYRELARPDSRLSFFKPPSTPQAGWDRAAQLITRLWPAVVLVWAVGVLVLVT